MTTDPFGRVVGNGLPPIPVLEVGPDWPYEALERASERLQAMLDAGSGRIPPVAIRIADALSRGWLRRRHPGFLSEIDRIADRVGRPGAYCLNISYEWGCTASAVPSPDGRSARLLRVLDWPDRGLGRYVIALRIAGAAGPWLTLTWPGYTGVLQAVAAGRFAAALNQAPMAQPVGLLPVDWLLNRAEVWRRSHVPPAYLLRRVFEQARTYAEAKAMLTQTPVAIATIFTLAGLAADETCVIERQPEDAHVIEGPACAANDWQAPGWRGRPRGCDNPQRRAHLRGAAPSLDEAFGWLQPPVLNDRTRLALVACAATGRVVAQGWEQEGPATAVLSTTVA